MERYEDVHSAVVASSGYHRAVHSMNEAVASLQASSVYRLAARNLWWTVSPVAGAGPPPASKMLPAGQQLRQNKQDSACVPSTGWLLSWRPSEVPASDVAGPWTI